MNILPVRDPGISELDMQESLVNRLRDKCWKTSDPYWMQKNIDHHVLQEIRIPNIGRISDIIVYVTPRKIINIECKLKDYGCVFEQAKDHLLWADYSYICFHADTNLPVYVIQQMIDNGIGLIFWRENEFPVEVLQASWNKGKDKHLRKIANGVIEKHIQDLKRQEEANKHIQTNLF